MRARIDELLELLRRDEGDAANDAAGVELMTQAEYAKRLRKSVTTVRKWVRAGLPHRRRGRLVLIDVAKAHNWELRTADARTADHAAHGGSRR